MGLFRWGGMGILAAGREHAQRVRARPAAAAAAAARPADELEPQRERRDRARVVDADRERGRARAVRGRALEPPARGGEGLGLAGEPGAQKSRTRTTKMANPDTLFEWETRY